MSSPPTFPREHRTRLHSTHPIAGVVAMTENGNRQTVQVQNEIIRSYTVRATARW